MRKLLRKKLNNRGNTFVVIMVTLACMGILIGVIMASVGYFYRMRYVDLENKNNFYYVEKAMDDIYAGIGSDSVSALMSAYESTVEVMVYYYVDPVTGKGRYVSIGADTANFIMKQKFLSNLAESDTYKSQSQLYDRLKSFISVDDVSLVDPATLSASQPRLYLEVVTSEENGKTIYDKLIIHNVTVTRTTEEGYIQSITTDIEISEPEFDVSFSNVDGSVNALYEFSMLADMGIEFNRATTGKDVISVTGNVYAASDYYNKEYNEVSDTNVSSYYNGSAESLVKLSACDGMTEASRYSGIYVNASNLNIMAEKVIVPGSISVMNDANVSILGNLATGSGNAQVWADNIVMAPSFTRTVGMNFSDGTLSMFADAFIADDLEINSDDATLELSGNYYGYNFSQTAATERVLSQYAKSGRAHYNSSAIIVNGNAANIDMTGLNNLYVAGRSYISTTETRRSSVADDGTSATVNYVTWEDNTDVRTGESISMRTNQMAYMPLGWYVQDGERMPKFTDRHVAFNKTIYDRIKNWLDPTNPMVEQEVSGNTYYFLNFRSATAAADFFDWYVNDLPNLPGYELATDIVNIRDYTDNLSSMGLDVGANATQVTTSGAYTSGAVNVAKNRRLTIASPTLDANLINGESQTIVNFNQRANQYNSDYMEMKYALQTIDVSSNSPYSGELLDKMEQLKTNIAAMNSKDVTPINHYLDFSKITGSAMNGVQIGNAYVWISDGDVTVNTPVGSNGKILGLIIAKGDVNFTDDTLKRFEGLIVSGSKIKVNHRMDFIANPEIVKTILRTADATKGNAVGDYSGICEIFKDYSADADGSGPEGTDVGNIELGDILRYNNWKKNVQ
ncbi:MAG: hypothetical protein K2N24_07155 [Lachnospiraceae bacterium]|nr:hypothetical protein [Lachnospiraceae bacterium]